MEGLKLIVLDPASKDERGATYEWVKGMQTRQLTICQRNKGTVSGNHYHKGEDPSKRPERVLILRGIVKVRACDGMQTVENLIDNPFTEINISPRILHSYIAEEDTLFIEQRTSPYDQINSDTYPHNTFEDYLGEQSLTVHRQEIERFMFNQGGKLI